MSGIYSMKNPTLDNEGRVPLQSNLTLIMPNHHHGGGGGALHFSVLAGNEMPFDRFEYYVDGVSRGSINDPRTEFEELELQVGPGSHVFDFVYKFNPQDIPAAGFPPPEAFPERNGLVYVDHVYFIPSDGGGGNGNDIPSGGISSTNDKPTSSPTSSLNATSSSSSEPAATTTTTTTIAPSSKGGTSIMRTSDTQT